MFTLSNIGHYILQVKVGGKFLGECIDNADIDTLTLASKTEYFDEGTKIVVEGSKGDMFYIIEEGTVAITKENLNSDSPCILKKGDFFGEEALLSEDTRMATATAASTVRCLVLIREDFVRILGNLQEIIDESNDRRLALQRQDTTKKANVHMKRRSVLTHK